MSATLKNWNLDGFYSFVYSLSVYIEEANVVIGNEIGERVGNGDAVGLMVALIDVKFSVYRD